MKFLTIEEIAEICSVSQKTIRRQVAAGTLKARRVGNLWRIEKNDLNEWLNGQPHHQEKPENRHPQLNLFGEPVEVKNDVKKSKTEDKVNWIAIDDIWDNIKNKGKYTFIDLFAGAGGLSLGLEMAGLHGVAAVEYEKTAVETYRTNFHHPVVDEDIRNPETKLKLYEIIKNATGDGSVDIICGGFPCQGFSMSGHRIVEDKRNSLYKDMLEIVNHLRPRFVVMENVTGLRSMLEGKIEEKIINDLENLGYEVNVTVLNAADYNTPQLRKRVIFIANRMNKKNYHPKPIVDPENYRTTCQAIEDLMSCPDNKDFNHVTTRHSLQMQERLGNVPEGGSLYENYSDAWKKCPWNEASCTIKENHGGVNIHPRLPRVLTAREMARIQSFPDNFIFKGSKKWQLVQIGNAVPPLLGKAIGIAVYKSLEEK